MGIYWLFLGGGARCLTSRYLSPFLTRWSMWPDIRFSHGASLMKTETSVTQSALADSWLLGHANMQSSWLTLSLAWFLNLFLQSASGCYQLPDIPPTNLFLAYLDAVSFLCNNMTFQHIPSNYHVTMNFKKCFWKFQVEQWLTCS